MPKLKYDPAKKIYFDLDGVLANFEKMAALTLFDYHWNKHDDTHWAIWDKIPHLFKTLEPLPEGIRFYHEVVKRVGASNVEILTAVPDPTGLLVTSATDKTEWVREHVDKKVVVNTVHGGNNKILWLRDNPGSILIDDYERNIKLWNEHGGIGIQYVDAASTKAKLAVAGLTL